MTVTINGSGSITEEITIDGVKVGQGAGNVATNTAVGVSALAANTTGSENTAVGSNAFSANTTGGANAAFGRSALAGNTTGTDNCAFGLQSLFNNTTGGTNVGIGYQALFANTTGARNTAVGYRALDANQTNGDNVAVGHGALTASTSEENCAIGYAALESLTTGVRNTAIGYASGSAMTTGSKNVIVGRYSGNQDGLDIRTASNYIVLSDGDGNVRLYFNGNDLISPGVHGNTTANAANVAVLSAGNLRRSTSSRRYKNTISDATHGLAELLTLRPVTYKGNNDGETVFGGLIAEEVHDAGLTEFVQYAADGTPDSLAYGNMVSLCVKAIQELSAQVTALQAEVNALKGQ
jgi:hypothetical protein